MRKPMIVLAWGLLLILGGAQLASADFAGKPPLGPGGIRHEFAPYDLAKLNCLALNYCENLVDLRVNLVSYTHMGYDLNASDAWSLQFPDDNARIIEGLAWEARYAPVARLELTRRLVKGLLAAHVPGTRAEYFFRHRNEGKTFLIFDDQPKENQGRLTLSNWNDTIEGAVKIGFRARMNGAWHSIEEFPYTDDPVLGAHPEVARQGRTAADLTKGGPLPPSAPSPSWNKSPYVLTRHYQGAPGKVEFNGRYGMSDEDLPLEYGFHSAKAEELEIVVGEPGHPIPLLNNKDLPGLIHLPDRKTVYSSDKQGTVTLQAPAFNYFILHKKATWACPGYSSALLVMWDGHPSQIEALPENGYGEIRLRYAKAGDAAGGKLWLYPIPWCNDTDMGYTFRNAESFLATGHLMQNGFPSQQMVNAVPAGLAAGAWLLTRYNDPAAATACIQAESAVDAMLQPEDEGKYFVRTFFEVKAAAWMVLLGKERHDQAMVDKYVPWVDRIMKRMLSNETFIGYDGAAWVDGWTHFNGMKALWLAAEATGRDDYRKAYERAMTVYTIDDKAIYRRGEALKAPGGFEMYSGALPLAIWGHDGALDNVTKLINLNAPNGWDPDPKVPLRDVWHDGGAGPWAQDDSQPDFVGYCLRGLNLPRDKQTLVPMGNGVMYDAKGTVTLGGGRILDNPFFRQGHDPVRVLKEGEKLATPAVVAVDCRPVSATEKAHLTPERGTLFEGQRVVKAGEPPLVYTFDLAAQTTGAALDLTLSGDAYQVDVSPDGERWYQRLDSWSKGPERRSLDLSFLTGSPDELVKLLNIVPAEDAAVLATQEKSQVEPEQWRRVAAGGSFVYRLALPGVTEARAELLIGNGYRVELSSDGAHWSPGLDASQFPVFNNKQVADAAWVRMLDLTPALGAKGEVFVRFSDLGRPQDFGGKEAFLRRLAVYGTIKTGKVFVRLTNASRPGAPALMVSDLTFRAWP